MMTRISLVGLTLILLAGIAGAQEPLSPELKGGAKLDALVERITTVQEQTRSLEASFEQVKVSRLLAAPSRTSGTFYFRAPDDVRWEYTAPRPMSVLLVEDYAITYRPAERRAERMELGRVQRKAFNFLGANEPLEQLRRHFSFTLRDRVGANYELILNPTTVGLRKRLKEVRIEIDRERFVPVAVSYTQPNGDSTAYTFKDIRRNVPLADDLFKLEIPGDVKVVEMKLRSAE